MMQAAKQAVYFAYHLAKQRVVFYPNHANRSIFPKLLAWLGEERRKPLILRGARQVGKTWLVRALARERGLALLEVNFERDPTMADAFRSADPMRIFTRWEMA